MYSIEATIQVAEVLWAPDSQERRSPSCAASSPEGGSKAGDRQFYFKDLPGDLQKVRRAQLRQPGDVSAAID